MPGIDFTNDPLLQGRLFSYLDTQLSRLGGPNFHEIPINRPRCPFHNGQRDGMHQMEIQTNATSYEPNSIDGGWPKEKPVERGGFASYPRLEGDKLRVRPSRSPTISRRRRCSGTARRRRATHIVAAFRSSSAKVEPVRSASGPAHSGQLDDASGPCADALGAAMPETRQEAPVSSQGIATALSGAEHDRYARKETASARTRKVAILAADGVDGAGLLAMKSALQSAGIKVRVLRRRGWASCRPPAAAASRSTTCS